MKIAIVKKPSASPMAAEAASKGMKADAKTLASLKKKSEKMVEIFNYLMSEESIHDIIPMLSSMLNDGSFESASSADTKKLVALIDEAIKTSKALDGTVAKIGELLDKIDLK